MKLRTFEGERLEGKLTTEHRISPDGSRVLLVNGDPFAPEEAEFFLESATQEEMEQLAEGRYDLAPWKEHEESDEYLDSESLEDESDDL